MRCTGYCIADSIDINALVIHYRKAKKTYKLYREVLHILFSNGEKQAHIFCFPYGAVLFFGLTKDQEYAQLGHIKLHAVDTYPFQEVDHFSYAKANKLSIVEDKILLPGDSVETKLAISHGIAQSLKLAIFERDIRDQVQATKMIPINIVRKGTTFLSRKQIMRQMGEIFFTRNKVNLHTDILDTPEYFWDHSETEYVYNTIARYLDLKQRVDVLNKRMDVLGDLFEMLSSQLNHQHSSRLEWTIIILIVIEVLLVISKDILAHYA